MTGCSLLHRVCFTNCLRNFRVCLCHPSTRVGRSATICWPFGKKVITEVGSRKHEHWWYGVSAGIYCKAHAYQGSFFSRGHHSYLVYFHSSIGLAQLRYLSHRSCRYHNPQLNLWRVSTSDGLSKNLSNCFY